MNFRSSFFFFGELKTILNYFRRMKNAVKLIYSNLLTSMLAFTFGANIPLAYSYNGSQSDLSRFEVIANANNGAAVLNKRTYLISGRGQPNTSPSTFELVITDRNIIEYFKSTGAIENDGGHLHFLNLKELTKGRAWADYGATHKPDGRVVYINLTENSGMSVEIFRTTPNISRNNPYGFFQHERMADWFFESVR
jgi:hypothetical protein